MTTPAVLCTLITLLAAPPRQPPPAPPGPPARPARTDPLRMRPTGSAPAPAAARSTLRAPRITFARLLQEALRRNRDLKRAGLDLASARQDVRSARGMYDTTLGAGLTYSRTSGEPVEGLRIQTLRSSSLEYNLSASQKLPTGGLVSLGWSSSRRTSLSVYDFSGTPLESETETWDTALTLSVTHPLLKGVGLDANLAAIRQARLARGAAAWAARAKAEAVVRDLYKAYLDVVAAEAGVRVQRDAVAQASRDLERSEAMVKAGRMAEADLVDYRFAVAQQRRALLEAQTVWLQASLALRLLSGERIRPGRGRLGTTLPRNPFPGGIPSAKGAADAALRHSRDLLAALEQLKIKEISLTTTGRDTWPSLDLSASIGPQGRAASFTKAHENLFKFKSLGWSVGLSFSYLIGNRAARAAAAKARLDVRRQKVAIDELRQGLVSEATRTVAQLRLDEQLARTATLEHRLAAQRLDNERKRHAAGRSSVYIVLQLQNEVTKTAHKAFTARLGVLKRRAELEALTGTLLGRFGLKPSQVKSLRLRR